MSETWIKWFKSQSQRDRDKMAIDAITRLIEVEEVRFREYEYDEIEEEHVPETLCWTNCGESLKGE